MNIIADIKTWLSASIAMYGVMTIDNFGTPVEALMIRGEPSTLDETFYMNGKVQGTQNFSIYARSKSNATAINALDAIKNKLWLQGFPITGVTNITVKIKTTASYISGDATTGYVYGISGTLEYYGM